MKDADASFKKESRVGNLHANQDLNRHPPGQRPNTLLFREGVRLIDV